MLLRIVHSDGSQAEVAFADELVRLGRDADCEVPFDQAAYPTVSGRHAQIARTPAGLELVHLSRSNKTLLNGQPVAGRMPLAVGDAIRLGYAGPVVIVVATSPPSGDGGDPVAGALEGTLAALPQHLALLRGTATAANRFEIGTGGAIGRERGKVRFLLDHPHVSRFHASLSVQTGRVVLADNRSANGTFVNGCRIAVPDELAPRDRIDIGPFSLVFDGAALIGRSRANHIEL